MQTRPAMLNSNIMLQAINPAYQDTPEIRKVVRSIERLGELNDALAMASKAVNPHETPEAKAMRYEEQYRKAVVKAKEIGGEAMAALQTLGEVTKTTAIAEAGLDSPPKNAAEIRTALRSMKPSERDKAVMEAFEAKDAEILASIFGQNAITWGGTDTALETHFELFINQAAPQSVGAREAGAKAEEGFHMAADAFAETAKSLRQAHIAEKGFKQMQEFEEAEAQLSAALET